MKLSSKQILIVVAVVIVIFIGVAYWYYRKGKKQTTIAPIPNDSPTGINNPSGVSLSSISQLADELYQEMNGVSLYRDSQPYVKLLVLSDTDFVKVYNSFNEKYQKEGEGTLKQWIEGEYGLGQFDTLKTSILSRVGRLNLI